eukprot:COSAG05_NODE_1514_length_4665_cov_54.657687_2_plen_97_part_00
MVQKWDKSKLCAAMVRVLGAGANGSGAAGGRSLSSLGCAAVRGVLVETCNDSSPSSRDDGWTKVHEAGEIVRVRVDVGSLVCARIPRLLWVSVCSS